MIRDMFFFITFQTHKHMCPESIKKRRRRREGGRCRGLLVQSTRPIEQRWTVIIIKKVLRM